MESSINPRRPTLNKTEFTRIITQSLYSLGYPKSAALLQSESGIPLDSPLYTSLLSHILSGRWDDCISAIKAIPDLSPTALSAAAFLIWKQHFLELLGSGSGLEVLRGRISPLGMERGRVHRLARALVLAEGVVRGVDVGRRRVGLVMDLMDVLPVGIRVPGGRLEQLVETAVLRQAGSCFYHNSPADICLYEDHRCGREQIPYKCGQTLHDHKNEVWFVQFSNDGEYLASSSSDCTAIIWKVKEDDSVSLRHILVGHKRPVSFVAWSPDDSMLLTCGNEELLKLWVVDTGVCNFTFTSPINCIISSCAWFPDSKKIVCGSCEPDNRIYTCDLEGNELEVWEGERMPKVSELAVTPDGHHLISICSNREIWIREIPRGKEWVITEEHSITSLSLSRDGQSLIVNLNSEEIHLWYLQGNSNLPEKFRGHKQGKYVIRSCFGGTSCLFIASGSEDSKVYIWQRHQQTPIQVLSGHSTTVNSVSWNPVKHHMLASGSDDCTIRIWVANKSPTEVSK